jgi:hypothetical protein
MRALVCIAVLLVCPLAAADTITLGAKPTHAVGQKQTITKSVTSDMVVTAKGKQVKISMKQLQRKRVEVLAVGAGLVTKAKVTYDEDSKVDVADGKQKGGPSSLVGKTFTITAGSPLEISGGDIADADIVRKREKRFGQSDQIRKAIAGKTFIKDKSVDLDITSLDDLPDSKVEKVTLTYRGMSGKLAKFGMRMVASDSKVAVDLTGTVLVDPASSDAVEGLLAGTVKGVSMSLKGTLTIEHRQQ